MTWGAIFIIVIGAVMAIPVYALAVNIAEWLWMIREEKENDRETEGHQWPEKPQ